MDEKEKEAKIQARREELRNGRISQASATLSPDDRDVDSQTGTTFQNTGREVSGLAGNSQQIATDDRQPAHNRRSAEEKPLGVRRPDRRLSESNSGPALDTAAADIRSVGRLLSDEHAPERVIEPDKPESAFKKPVQLNETRQKLSSKYPELNAILSSQPNITVENLAARLGVSTGTAHAVKKQWLNAAEPGAKEEKPFELPQLPQLFGKGKTLSEKEAREMAEPLAASLESDFEYLDQYLWLRQKAAGKDSHEQPIWSDVDEEEIAALTKIMLRWGQRNAAAAAVARGVVESADYIAVGAIFAPRINRTVEVMRETRLPRARRGEQPHDTTH